jgi:hypothetical protein
MTGGGLLSFYRLVMTNDDPPASGKKGENLPCSKTHSMGVSLFALQVDGAWTGKPSFTQRFCPAP